MSNSEFPPNSEVSKQGKIEDKNVERVTSSDAIRRKKSLRKQFMETFIAGDLKTAIQSAIMETLLPMARDMVLDTIQQGFERLFLGNSRRRGPTPPQSGRAGFVDYQRMSPVSRLSSQQRVLSRQARSQHNFDEIVLASRTEAEEVIDRLFDIVRKYDTASVADLYDLIGFTSAHTDNKWGWTDLSGAGVSRARGGYLLDLPDPQPLD